MQQSLATEALANGESMATYTAQSDSYLEVPGSEVQQALRIIMNHKLLKAARSGNNKILDELLGTSTEHIAIPVEQNHTTQKDTSCLLGVTIGGNTALHIAASEGHLVLAENICRRDISLLAAPNTRLDTPLHCAAKAGDDRMVSRLIQLARERGIEASRVLCMRNWEDGNALHEAAKYNHVRVAEVLMEEDAELACMLDGARMSPLYLAIMTGSLAVAKALLRSSSGYVDSLEFYAGPHGGTALHAAVLLSPEIIEDILRRKPTLAKAVNWAGKIPLHYAAAYGHLDTVKQLLEHDPSTAYKSDDNGFFPIHNAASMGKMAVIDQILHQCPDADELLDGKGKNFLHIAFQWKKLDVVKKTISKRPHLRKLLNDQDNEGNTPLHTAVGNRDQQSVLFLLQDKSVNFNIVNHNSRTPLDLAFEDEDKGLYFLLNANDCIGSCLALAKAMLGPHYLNYRTKMEPFSDKTKDDNMVKDREIKKELNLSRNLAIASVLIATIAFAAGFTLPGGYIDDDHSGHGTAVLAKEYPFRVFLVSNAFAFVCSVIATCLLMYAGTLIVDEHTRQRTLLVAMTCLRLAFSGISTAFAMGIYVVLPRSCKGLGILLCFCAIGAPLLAAMVTDRNIYSMLKTIGVKRWIYPIIDPYVAQRWSFSFRRNQFISGTFLYCGTYAIFFLLPMIYISKN